VFRRKIVPTGRTVSPLPCGGPFPSSFANFFADCIFRCFAKSAVFHTLGLLAARSQKVFAFPYVLEGLFSALHFFLFFFFVLRVTDCLRCCSAPRGDFRARAIFDLFSPLQCEACRGFRFRSSVILSLRGLAPPWLVSWAEEQDGRCSL